MQKLLEGIYPGVKWLPWKFQRVPARFWNEFSNQKAYFDWLGEHLRINRQILYHTV